MVRLGCEVGAPSVDRKVCKVSKVSKVTDVSVSGTACSVSDYGFLCMRNSQVNLCVTRAKHDRTLGIACEVQTERLVKSCRSVGVAVEITHKAVGCDDSGLAIVNHINRGVGCFTVRGKQSGGCDACCH